MRLGLGWWEGTLERVWGKEDRDDEAEREVEGKREGGMRWMLAVKVV